MSRTRARGAAFAVDPRFCCRTPLLPLSAFTELGTDVDGARARLRALVDRPEVREAIFIASPDLHDGIACWQRDPDGPRGQHIERSLVRYVSRMAGRATPFGAFSGVSVAAWADDSLLPVGPVSEHRRRTRLDHDYLDELCAALRARPEIRDRLRYAPSSSLYLAGGRMRYVEERVRGRCRSHHLVSIERTAHLAAVLELARGGATREDMVRTLLEGARDVSREEAQSFVDQLIDCRILVGQLAPQVTGDEGLRGVIGRLRAAGEAPPLSTMAASLSTIETVQTEMESLDAARLGASPERYLAIADRLRALPVPLDIRRLFQVDLVVPAPGARLSRQVADEIAAGVALLHRMTRRPADDALATFRAETHRDGLAREFRAGTDALRQMGARYRAERGRMAALLAGRSDDASDSGETRLATDHTLAVCLDHLARRSERARPLARELRARAAAGHLSAGLDDIARSLIHLHLNRLLRSSQRAQELVLSDLLRRHYESLLARGRAAAP